MATKSPTPSAGISRRRTDVAYVGSCVVCKCAIFTDMKYGRAPRPLLGIVHAWCVPGGAR